MLLKQTLLKQTLLKATKGKTGCSSKGCPIYDINVDNQNLNEMYRYFTGENVNLDNHFSFCSECFLYLCYEYNKEVAKKMFDKYVFYKGEKNFFYNNGKSMPCGLLGEMAKFMFNNKKSIDIE